MIGFVGRHSCVIQPHEHSPSAPAHTAETSAHGVADGVTQTTTLLANLRDENPAPARGPDQIFLQTQAGVAAAARGASPSEPNAIVDYEMDQFEAARREFETLSPEQQTQFRELATSQLGGCDPEGTDGGLDALAAKAARRGLYSLLGDGQMTSVDSQGQTLLGNLTRLREQPLAEGIDRERLFRDTVIDSVNPMSSHYQQMGTVAAEELQVHLAQQRPAELARVVSGLASPEGASQLGSVELQRPEGYQFDRGAMGTESGSLLQASLTSHQAETALFESEVLTNQELGSAYQSLSPQDQRLFRELHQSLVPDGERIRTPPPAPGEPFSAPTKAEMDQKARIDQMAKARSGLNEMLRDGRLLETDQDGNSLLQNLDTIRTQPRAEENGVSFDREQVLLETVRQTSDPGLVNQKNRSTCTVASIEYLQAKNEPADYARIVAGLTGETGSVTLSNGETLSRDDNLVAEDDSGRTSISRVYQASLIEYANGDQDYRNEDDAHYQADGTPAQDFEGRTLRGLSSERIGKAATGVLQGDYQTVRAWNMGGVDEVTKTIREATSQDRQALVTMRWNLDPDREHSSHTLALVGSDQDYVYLRNPWGTGETGNQDGSKSPVREALNHDTSRERYSPPELFQQGRATELPDGDAGTFRMTWEEFLGNLSGHTIEQ